jgi:hypothetical protein
MRRMSCSIRPQGQNARASVGARETNGLEQASHLYCSTSCTEMAWSVYDAPSLA